MAGLFTRPRTGRSRESSPPPSPALRPVAPVEPGDQDETSSRHVTGFSTTGLDRLLGSDRKDKHTLGVFQEPRSKDRSPAGNRDETSERRKWWSRSKGGSPQQPPQAPPIDLPSSFSLGATSSTGSQSSRSFTTTGDDLTERTHSGEKKKESKFASFFSRSRKESETDAASGEGSNSRARSLFGVFKKDKDKDKLESSTPSPCSSRRGSGDSNPNSNPNSQRALSMSDHGIHIVTSAPASGMASLQPRRSVGGKFSEALRKSPMPRSPRPASPGSSPRGPPGPPPLDGSPGEAPCATPKRTWLPSLRKPPRTPEPQPPELDLERPPSGEPADGRPPREDSPVDWGFGATASERSIATQLHSASGYIPAMRVSDVPPTAPEELDDEGSPRRRPHSPPRLSDRPPPHLADRSPRPPGQGLVASPGGWRWTGDGARRHSEPEPEGGGRRYSDPSALQPAGEDDPEADASQRSPGPPGPRGERRWWEALRNPFSLGLSDKAKSAPPAVQKGAVASSDGRAKLCAGFLSKQRRKTKTWTERYYELDYKSLVQFLTAPDDKERKARKKGWSLAGGEADSPWTSRKEIPVAQIVTPTLTDEKKFEFCFAVGSAGGMSLKHFRAATREEAIEWVQALRDAIARHKPPRPPFHPGPASPSATM